MTCTECGAGRTPAKHHDSGLCKPCYRKWWRAKQPPCKLDGCEEPRLARGWCPEHYNRWQRYGDPLGLPANGKKARKKGTGNIRKDGYIQVTLPDGTRDLQHRVVMAEFLGRALRKGEQVHHKYGDKTDSAIEHLELWASVQPHGQRVTDLVAWAREILALYGDEADRLDLITAT